MINQEVKEFMGILLHVVIELLWKEEENTIIVAGKSNKSNTSLMYHQKNPSMYITY